MPGVVATVSHAARDPDLRRLQVVLAAFAVTEHATWVALLVHAYARGGVDEAGVVAVLLLLPALVAAPLTAVAADRFRGDRVLAVASAFLALTCALAGLAMWIDLGIGVYALVALTAVAVTIGRPTVSAVLPAATHVPSELTAANVVFGAIENSGLLVGPGLAAGVIAVWSPGAVFVACAVFMAVAVVACSGIELEPSHLTLTSSLTPRQVLRDTLGGLTMLRRERGVRLALLMVSIASIGNGVCDVLYVSVSDAVGDGGTDRAGLLGCAFGVGSLIGSGLMVSLVGRARITPFLVVGVMAMSLPLAGLSVVSGLGGAALLFGVAGLGGSVVMIAATTMVQRIARSDVLGRTFGIVEGLRQGSIAVGSAAVTLAVSGTGLATGVVLVAAGMLALLALRIVALLRLDRGATPPDPRVVELLVGDRITGVLPAPAIERLAQSAERIEVPTAVAITTQGEMGDNYYIIDSGLVSVAIDGAEVRALGRGEGFGEIAPLEKIPRTATVTSLSPTQVVVIDPVDFIEAVTGHPRGLASVRRRSAVYVGVGGLRSRALPPPRPVQVFPPVDLRPMTESSSRADSARVAESPIEPASPIEGPRIVPPPLATLPPLPRPASPSASTPPLVPSGPGLWLPPPSARPRRPAIWPPPCGLMESAGDPVTPGG